MSCDKTALYKFLCEKPLIASEKRMWYHAGFYIESTAYKDKYDRDRVQLVDHLGNTLSIPSVIGFNIRLATIEWWEIYSKAITSTPSLSSLPFDEIEVTRQA